MSNLYITLFLALVNLSLFAQQGNLVGKIQDTEGQPIELVNLSLLDTEFGTSTDIDGNYLLSNIPYGSYTVQISKVGYAEQLITIEINQANQSLAAIKLEVSNNEIDEISIVGTRVEKSTYVAKMDLAKMENPQIYSTVTATTIQQQNATDIDRVMDNAPGVYTLWSPSARVLDGGSSYAIRGFSAQAKMMNGIAGPANLNLDPYAVQNVEVVKGPTGTLYGSSLVGLGGLINIVTKQPMDKYFGEIKYTAGSFGLHRINADVNLPFGENNRVQVRTLGGYHSEDTYKTVGYSKSYFIAPSLRFKASEKFRFDVAAYYSNLNAVYPSQLFLNRTVPLSFNSPSEMPFDPYESYTTDKLPITKSALNIKLETNYKFNKNWNMQSVFFAGVDKLDGTYVFATQTPQLELNLPALVNSLLGGNADTVSNIAIPAASFLQNFLGLNDDTLILNDKSLAMIGTHNNVNYKTKQLQVNFSGDYDYGKVRNRILVGADFLSTSREQSIRLPLDLGTFVGPSFAGIKFPYAILEDASTDTYNITQGTIDNILETLGSSAKSADKNHNFGVYLSDVFTFWQDRVLLMASVRLDYNINDIKEGSNAFGTQKPGFVDKKFTVSPKFGFTVELVKNKLAIFGNYMNGFVMQSAEVQSEDGSIFSFDPVQANQLEAGVKLSLLKNKLSLTSSYFNIKAENLKQADFTKPPGNWTQGGIVYLQGAEVALGINPISGLSFTGGYTFTESRHEETDPELEGRRYNQSGPKHTVNFWANYTFNKTKVKGLGFGFGGNFASDYNTIDALTAGVFTLPRYVVFNTGIYYQHKKTGLGASFHVNNLLDKEYYKGWTTIDTQKPRSFVGSISYQFNRKRKG